MSNIIALSGGVGGAKLALGLSHVLPAENLTVVCNTADDFEHLGLAISPDLDTVMYTLAARNNPDQGWGLANESWHAMAMFRDYGVGDWFQLGDRDLATHILRTERLSQGQTLTQVTAGLAKSLGVNTELLPMTDDPVRTFVETDQGRLPFQHYFVRERCVPVIRGYEFKGITKAQPQPQFLQQLQSPLIDAVIICPSNPFVSVAPILQLPGIRQALQNCLAPVIAVSPIVAGKAIKGPAAKMMQELGFECSAAATADFYRDVIDGFVLDCADADQTPQIQQQGVAVHCCNTVMQTLQDRITLARQVLNFSQSLKSE